MDQMNQKDNSQKSGGRKLKKDPSVFRYSVNLNEVENAKFQAMLRKSDAKNISKFIVSMLFGREMKVVKIDKAAMDYYMRLTTFYSQYQAIGVNYNQTVKAIKTSFTEKRALSLLYKLEKATIELVKINREIIKLTAEFEEKWLQK